MPIRLSRVLAFWLPLAATWAMMAVEGPFLSAVVARLGNPVVNLAAFGLAFNLAWLAESPIIMLLSASIAVSRDRPSYLALRRFVNLLNAGVTLLLILLVLPGVFRLLAGRVLGLPPEVAVLAHRATVLLLPWPAAIGLRRFLQGVLVRNGQTRRVAQGTLVRLACMALAAALLALATRLPGALIGSLALSAGVVGEAGAAWFMARKAVQALAPGNAQEPPPSQRDLLRFYLPLALTSILAMVSRPLLLLFMGRAADPVACMAAWPVLMAFNFFFRGGGVAFQEVSVALLGKGPGTAAAVRRAAILLAGTATGVLALFVAPPLARAWFQGIMGLGHGLMPFVLLPNAVLLLYPALEYLLSYQRSEWILARRTRVISEATVLEIAGLLLVMPALALGLGWRGTLAAAAALLAGRLASCGYLALRARGNRPGFQGA